MVHYTREGENAECGIKEVIRGHRGVERPDEAKKG
jgi:hypothetical protein